jgi:hypothetical protein
MKIKCFINLLLILVAFLLSTYSVWAEQVNDNTTNQPPNIPSNPTPSDKEDKVPLGSCLSWIGGDPDGDAVTYEVYFGKNPNPPFYETECRIDDEDDEVCEPEDLFSCPRDKLRFFCSLRRFTTYYWKIVAIDEHGAKTEGPVWTFKTGGRCFFKY